jgi:hypothetical protein
MVKLVFGVELLQHPCKVPTAHPATTAGFLVAAAACEVLVKNQSKLVKFRNVFGMPHPEGLMADRSDAPQGR